MFPRTLLAVCLAVAVLGASLWIGLIAGRPVAASIPPQSAPQQSDSAPVTDAALPAPLPATLAEAVGAADQAAPEAKLSAGLLEFATEGSPKAKTWVIVQSLGALDLSRFGGFAHQFTWPAGEHVAVVEIPAGAILDLAAMPGVYAVDWAVPEAPSQEPAMPAPDGGAPVYAPKAPAPSEMAAMRAAAHAAPPWSETKAQIEAVDAAAPSGPSIGSTRSTSSTPDSSSFVADRAADPSADGWFDIRAGHAAKEAWDMGVKGDGVRVAVLDDAVDFAHPDLQGTWAVLPEGHPYGGWPQVFDPDVGYLAIQDKALPAEQQANRSTRTARNGMIDLYQDSPVAMKEISGTMKATACFKPYQIIGPAGGPFTQTLGVETCDFIVPATSKSGILRYGHHPDVILPAMGAKPALQIQAESPGVIIVDEGASGVYDTVYVDINNNHDFSDEKPMNKASPLGWRDTTGDAIADYSGGLLYFIADGKLPFPASWVWGLEKDIPEAGRTIGILYILGAHGTLCASNIVSQGRLGVPADRDLSFRDLPGDHQPPSVNLGMAPEAELVSIGEIYAFGRAMFAPSWHYAAFGHDKERHDDDIQVTSNSYGWSDEDNDGWDPDSRLIDYYVRKFAPQTTFLFATGNGGTGYGTLAPPSPSVGIDVAASTQFGSTGADSITDTTQITFGDIIPFSNRGPGANGQNGPDIAADGAYAAGAIPINFVGNGTLANATWGGTSRSTPVAAGGTALVYQAFKQKHGRWPTWQEARAIQMAGARYAGYDTFVMGAGVLDSGDAVRIAAGRHGAYAIPSEWTAGNFRGTQYGAPFARTLAPGASESTKITLKNPSNAPVDVTLSAKTLRRTSSYEGSLVGDRTKESTPWGLPEYLVPIDKSKIPEGTDLMIVRGIFPYDEYDLLGDRVADNFYVPGVIQHTDINGDGKLWDDKNGNGVVNNQVWTPEHVTLAWSDAGGDQNRDHPALQGGFTKPLTAEGLTAEIAWYGDGCNDSEGKPPVPAQEVAEKIALIQRSTCTFVEKIQNAQKAGAIGVVMMTDGRPIIAMGGDPTGIEIPSVMIEQGAGQELRTVLETGTGVIAGLLVRPNLRLKGIDGGLPIRAGASEIQPFEFMTMNSENGLKNHWAIPIHHPRERWANGIYLSLQHVIRSESVTDTHITYRVDSYAYRDWTALSLAQTRVTIPAGGEVTVDATLKVPADAAYGAMQGAIFADYDRGAGDVAVAAPGGYELPNQRIVIPVNTTVGARYDWKGSIGLGGTKGDDRDAPYNNGAMYGTFKWNWRPESGDWRFFFVDGASQPAPGTFWMFRTRWNDTTEKQADIDTRIFGPSVDRYSNPADPANQPPDPADPSLPADDRSDPAWFGPYSLALLARSTYLALGSVWPFNTSSGSYEDWLAAPAGEGLHEVMLHNVLFSGTQFEMPYDTTVSSLRLTQRMGGSSPVPVTAASGLTLIGGQCASIDMTSEMDIPDFQVRGFGMSTLDVTRGLTVTQSATPGDPSSSSFKKTIQLTEEAGRFRVSIAGVTGDDLDLFLLYDANRNGQFEFPTEQVASSTSPIDVESVEVPGFPQLGDYQVWVLGWGLADQTKPSTFDLTVDIVQGNSIVLKNPPSRLVAGQTASIEVCAELATLTGQPGPASGLAVFGPSGAPQMFQIPVTWHRTLPQSIWLPAAVKSADLGQPMP